MAGAAGRIKCALPNFVRQFAVLFFSQKHIAIAILLQKKDWGLLTIAFASAALFGLICQMTFPNLFKL